MDEQNKGLDAGIGATDGFQQIAPILPEGWDGKSDFFTEQPDAMSDSSDNGESETSDAPTTGEQGETESVPTTDATDNNAENAGEANPPDGDQQATESPDAPKPEAAKRELRLKVNHEDRTVDVNAMSDEELTVLLQKGHAYDTLKAAQSDARNAEKYRAQVQRFIQDSGHDADTAKALAASLTGGKVYPVSVSDDGVVTLSDDYKPFPNFAEIETAPDAQAQQQTPKPTLDAELTKLRAAFPNLTEIPEGVTQLTQSGWSLTDAVMLMQMRGKDAELAKLRKENQVLKQNEDARKRAPVKGVSSGGSPKPSSKQDLFLKGLREG